MTFLLKGELREPEDGNPSHPDSDIPLGDKVLTWWVLEPEGSKSIFCDHTLSPRRANEDIFRTVTYPDTSLPVYDHRK